MHVHVHVHAHAYEHVHAYVHAHVHVHVCVLGGGIIQRWLLLLWLPGHVPSALIRWLTSVQSGTHKPGPSN